MLKNDCPKGRIATVFDLGINFNGYPMEDMQEDVCNAVFENMHAMERHTKNRRYKLVLIEVEDDAKEQKDKGVLRQQ